MQEHAPIVEINCATGEVIERQPTPEEIQQREADILENQQREAARKAEFEARALAKQSAQEKLKSLGLTDAEIAAITGI